MDALNVNLLPTQKLVWLAISYRSGDKNECWPSLDRLCRDTGLSRSAVCKTINDLEAIGLVSRDSPAGGKTTRYYIHCARAGQLTVLDVDTKEIERNLGTLAPHIKAARRQLELARAATRRNGVRDAFYRLIAVLPPEVVITVPMLARECVARQSQVRSDMNYLIKHQDITFDYLGRFGRCKPNRANFGKGKKPALKVVAGGRA